MRSLYIVALLATLAVGCGTGRHVQKGINAYNVGDYNNAMATWITVEGMDLNAKARVRYLVYRGLTHHRLGQHQQAMQLLSQGRAAYQAGTPGWLPPPVVREMEEILGGGAAAQPPPPPPPPEPTPVPPPPPPPPEGEEPTEIQ